MRLSRTKYKIKKGKHKANGFNFGLYFGNVETSWEFKLPTNAWYPEGTVEPGVNKICGFSFGFNHHKDSIRLGWQPAFDDEGMVWLYYYTYKDGKRTTDYLMKVDARTGLKHSLTIKVQGDRIIMIIDGIVFNRIYKMKPKWGYYLFPYFGGIDPAPYNMEFYLKRT